jgi:beta-glucosidase
MGWNIDPSGMFELLTDIGSRYPDLPLMVTENGAAFYDEVSDDGQVQDADRVSYLHGHINAVGEAIDAGVDVRGYFLWSLLDNFEWSWGYDRRFGIIRVDYDTLKRTVKDSGRWYSELIRTRQLPPVDATSQVLDAGVVG